MCERRKNEMNKLESGGVRHEAAMRSFEWEAACLGHDETLRYIPACIFRSRSGLCPPLSRAILPTGAVRSRLASLNGDGK